MSKHTKEMQVTVLRSWILNYSACRSLPSHRQVLQHETRFCSFTAMHQRDVVPPGTAQKQALNALDTEVWRPPSHFFSWYKLQHQHKSMTPLGFWFWRHEARWGAEEQAQQLTARYLGLGSNAAQKKSKHLHSGYGSFFPLIKHGPQEWDALRIQTFLQHSAPDEGAKVI